MARTSRAIAKVGGLRVLFALGVALLVLGMATPVVVASEDTPPATVLILFLLIAGPAFVLVFGAIRLPRSDVDPAFYPTVARWSVGGVVTIALLVGLYDLQPTGGIARPVSAIPPLLAVAAAAGFAGGVHDARARTRQRELDERNRELDERNRELDDRNRELQQTRAELEETVDRLRASNDRLEQFAYAVSHDLQEPLRTVSSHLQLLARRHEDALEDDAHEHLELSVDAAERMHAMVEGLLAYSRVETETQPFEPVDLNEVLAEARADLGQRIEESDAEVTVEELPTVAGDPDQLRQVFQNLLDNAIEYSGDEPPRVHVSAEPAEAPRRSVDGERPRRTAGGERQGDAAPADYWTIAVRDEGIGMEPEETERIFEVFERLHGPGEHEGTGVGLAIVKRIVERHGGEIWADSAPGEGTTFFLTLPANGADGADGATAARAVDGEQSASFDRVSGERSGPDDRSASSEGTASDEATTSSAGLRAARRRRSVTVGGRRGQ